MHGLLTTLSLLALLCASALPARAAGLLTFTFDDGMESVYTHALPVLKKYGQTATIGVIANMIDSGDPAYMTVSQGLDIQSQGWEIASHGMTHQRPVDIPRTYSDEPVRNWKPMANAPGIWQTRYRYAKVPVLLREEAEMPEAASFVELKTMPDAWYFDEVIGQLYLNARDWDPNTTDIKAGSYQRELEYSARVLTEMGFNVTDYISPYNYWTEDTERMSRRYYKAVATGEGEPNFVNTFDAHDLARIIVHADTSAEGIIRQVKAVALDKGGWVILCLHGIEDNVGYEPWAAEKLDKVAAWAQANGVRVVPLREGIKVIAEMRDKAKPMQVAQTRQSAPAKSAGTSTP